MLRPTLSPSLLLSTRRLASTKSHRPSKHTPSPPPPADDRNSPRRQTLRRYVLTGAFALITVVGTITGAQLKTDRDAVKQHKKFHVETPIDDRIAMLEDRRAGFMAMKMPLERKLAGLRARMDAAQKDQDGDKDGSR